MCRAAEIERGREIRTVKVTLAVDGERPAGVLGQGVEHVVEEADARMDGNCLRHAGLRGMAVSAVLEEARVGVRREVAAVQVDCELDLGLVGVASESGPAHGGLVVGAHCGVRRGIRRGTGASAHDDREFGYRAVNYIRGCNG